MALGSEAGMAQLLEEYLASPRLEHGQIVSGTVVRVSGGEIVVDINAKCEGIVAPRDLERLSTQEREAIKVGDSVVAAVVTPEDTNGNIILSLSRARLARDWLEAQRLLESQESSERLVMDYNKGGVIVGLGQLRGFVPGSHLAAGRQAARAGSGGAADERWAGLVGQKIPVKVIEVDQQHNRLILSQRAALRERQQSESHQLLSELMEGDVRRGRVIHLTSFGAFVDLGGLDGLVHLSEISWQRVRHPSDVLQVGQEVEVYVVEVDRERQRVALSLRRLQADPWVSVAERYQAGQLVQGVITHLNKWGAFATVVGDEAIEGLVHISELDERPVGHPSDVIQPDQVVMLRVVSVDAAHRRLALSLRQAAGVSGETEDWRAALQPSQPAFDRSLSAIPQVASALGQAAVAESAHPPV